MAEYTNWGIIIIAVAILFKVALGLFFRFKGKKTSSDALKASGLDALLDSLLSLGTLVGALVSRFASFYLEGYIGIFIGLFIIKSGVGVLRESLSSLIGERMEEGKASEIKKAILSHPEVKGAYDLIVNSYGVNKSIGSVHVEVDDGLTAREIHTLERTIAQEIFLNFGIVMTIGIYASNTFTPQLKKMKEDLQKIVLENRDFVQLHGFYVDEKTKIVSFDLVFSFEAKDPDQSRASIVEAMSKMYPSYQFVSVLDDDFA